MLKFARNKLTSVYRKGADRLSVHGILEDDIYGLEVDLDLSLSGLEVLSIQGRWNRMENAECPRALPFLQEAVGFRIDQDFTQKVQKIVGRKSCRHFADLILECGEAARDASRLIGGKDPELQRPEMEVKDYFGKAGKSGKTESAPDLSVEEKVGERRRESFRGMVIDLHVHSSPASPCSSNPVERLIEEARAIGLDGICLTDHNHVWDPDEVEVLRHKHDFLILRGNEITTDQGDILVLGLDDDIQGVIRLEELRERVLKAGGIYDRRPSLPGFSDLRDRVSRPDAGEGRGTAGLPGGGRRGGPERPGLRERKPLCRPGGGRPRTAADRRERCPSRPGRWGFTPPALPTRFEMNGNWSRP